MANTTADQGIALPLARSVTPGPALFRSSQPRRVLSGRISRRRSTSLSLTDLNRQAIWDETVLQSDPIPENSVPRTSAAFSLDPVPSLISSASSTPSTAAFDIFPCTESVSLPTTVAPQLSQPPLLSFGESMEFAVPSHFNFGSYPPSYQHGFLGSLLPEQKYNMSSESEQQPIYTSASFAQSPPMPVTSPALPSRSVSVEVESSQPAYSYPSGYTYPPATTMNELAPTYGYSPYSSLSGLSYGGSHDPRTHAYNVAYGQHYLPQPNAYGQHPEQSGVVDPAVMTHDHRPRVIDQAKEVRCWDHGCNGRIFSTHSNLLRHQREKNGSAAKSMCPKCGASFTRKTAMKGHMANDKCGNKKSGYNTPGSRSPSQSDR